MCVVWQVSTAPVTRAAASQWFHSRYLPLAFSRRRTAEQRVLRLCVYQRSECDAHEQQVGVVALDLEPLRAGLHELRGWCVRGDGWATWLSTVPTIPAPSPLERALDVVGSRGKWKGACVQTIPRMPNTHDDTAQDGHQLHCTVSDASNNW